MGVCVARWPRVGREMTQGMLLACFWTLLGVSACCMCDASQVDDYQLLADAVKREIKPLKVSSCTGVCMCLCVRVHVHV